MPEIVDRIAVAKSLATGVRKYVGRLDSQQLSRPSACAEWQIADVFSHLIGRGTPDREHAPRQGR